MTYFSKLDYKLSRFEISRKQSKKYDAILINKKTNKEKRIPFGDVLYQQYKDRTGLNHYSSKNHNDKKRRHSYRLRHHKDVKIGYFSPGYFSMYYLW